jgi:ABC-type Na+ transport system ATPase subunit NatA
MLSKDGQVQVDSMTCLAIQFVIAKLNNPLIYLLDDVYDGSDHPIANAIKAFIQNVSSDEVIIFATHNKNLMLDADIAVVMSAGAVERVAELNNEDPEANTVSGNDATNEANDKNNPELQKAGE